MKDESKKIMERLKRTGEKLGVKLAPAPETPEEEMRRLLLFCFEHLRHPMFRGEMSQAPEFKRIEEIIANG